MSQNKDTQPNTSVKANTSVKSTGPNEAENEKLKELVRTVKSLEASSEESVKGGGAKIEDETLNRSKRAVESYQKYLASKYGGDPASFTVSDEKEVKTGESGPEPTKVTGTFEGTADTSKTDSPDVAKF